MYCRRTIRGSGTTWDLEALTKKEAEALSKPPPSATRPPLQLLGSRKLTGTPAGHYSFRRAPVTPRQALRFIAKHGVVLEGGFEEARHGPARELVGTPARQRVLLGDARREGLARCACLPTRVGQGDLRPPPPLAGARALGTPVRASGAASGSRDPQRLGGASGGAHTVPQARAALGPHRGRKAHRAARAGGARVVDGRADPSLTHLRTLPLALGTASGALLLGLGGRLVMRLFAVATGRPHAFSLRGTLTVVFAGAVAGPIGGVLFWAVGPWLPAPPRLPGLMFDLLCLP